MYSLSIFYIFIKKKQSHEGIIPLSFRLKFWGKIEHEHIFANINFRNTYNGKKKFLMKKHPKKTLF